jgi:hypothetical protein
MRSPELALELRAARPAPSLELRERVLAVATAAPRGGPRLSLPSLRRVSLAAAAAVLVVAVGGALVHGLTHSGDRIEPVRANPSGGGAILENVPSAATILPRRADAVPTTPSRLQQYGATLRVQVKDRDELSDATKRAMRVARLLGGYVAQVRYSAPRSGVGSAAIVVRVPVDRVQDAIEEYSGLGTLLAQKVSITDVTKQVQEQAKEIARLRKELARLVSDGVTAAERPQLEALRARLDYLTKRRAATVRRAELAKVSLGLTTKRKAAAAPASRFDGTMSDARDVLVREAEILLYALIVAGPFLILGICAAVLARAHRRRLDERLLGRSA